MRIEYIGHALPSRLVTNEDIAALIRQHSIQFDGDLTQQARAIRSLLHLTGARTRYWLADGESPRGLIKKVCEQALAAVDPDGIDLLIYCSIHTELVEPSNANLIAQEMGLDRVECFDIKSGCDGWMKSAMVAQALIASGRYRNIMVVASEFMISSSNAIYPALFAMKSADQLVHTFPGLTLGEAATVTVLSAGGDEWRFETRTRNDLCDLCTITPDWYGKYALPSERVALSGAGRFTSFGKLMFDHAIPELTEMFNAAGVGLDDFDVLFTHASSRADWNCFCKSVGIESKQCDVYARYGNCVSASVPLSISDALTQGNLTHGGRALIISASAGMTFSLVQFSY